MFTFSTNSVHAAPRARAPVTVAGELIPTGPGFLRGHGTLVRQDGTLDPATFRTTLPLLLNSLRKPGPASPHELSE